MIMLCHIKKVSRKKKNLNISWSLLPNSSYSSDLAPRDVHLFYSLQNNLNDKNFSQEFQVKTLIELLLTSKQAEFYLRGIN